jgi:hypothetical protein
VSIRRTSNIRSRETQKEKDEKKREKIKERKQKWFKGKRLRLK